MRQISGQKPYDEDLAARGAAHVCLAPLEGVQTHSQPQHRDPDAADDRQLAEDLGVEGFHVRLLQGRVRRACGCVLK